MFSQSRLHCFQKDPLNFVWFSKCVLLFYSEACLNREYPCRQILKFKGVSALKSKKRLYIGKCRFVTAGHVWYRGDSCIEGVWSRGVSL